MRCRYGIDVILSVQAGDRTVSKSMKIEFNLPDVKLPKLTRKNLIIAGVTLTTLIGGFTAYKRHQWDQYVLACDEVRVIRADAKRLMFRSSFDVLRAPSYRQGAEMAILSDDVGELYRRANDEVRDCERRGV